jgi:hypothetical protein
MRRRAFAAARITSSIKTAKAMLPRVHARRVLAFLYIAGFALAAVAIALFLFSLSPWLGGAFVGFLWFREFLR